MTQPTTAIITYQLTWDSRHYSAVLYDPLGASGTLDGVSLGLPEGAYTTFRTYQHTRAIRFQDHLNRLVDSAERSRIVVNIHLPELRDQLRVVIRCSRFAEARVRISLDLTVNPGQIYVSLEPLHLLPPQAYDHGVKAISRVMHRDNPQAKLTTFIATAAGYRSQLPVDINEMLMIDPDGVMLEGLSSNFFGIRGGVLQTAETGVLPGITRSVVLDLARQLGISVLLQGVALADCPKLDECFISSASRGVLPVVQIDTCLIGSGKPGPVTQALMRAFGEWVEKAAEEI